MSLSKLSPWNLFANSLLWRQLLRLLFPPSMRSVPWGIVERRFFAERPLTLPFSRKLYTAFPGVPNRLSLSFFCLIILQKWLMLPFDMMVYMVFYFVVSVVFFRFFTFLCSWFLSRPLAESPLFEVYTSPQFFFFFLFCFQLVYSSPLPKRGFFQMRTLESCPPTGSGPHSSFGSGGPIEKQSKARKRPCPPPTSVPAFPRKHLFLTQVSLRSCSPPLLPFSGTAPSYPFSPFRSRAPQGESVVVPPPVL